MELVTVGTGTVAPSAHRTAPCHYVARGGLRILLDCGAGSLHRLAALGLPWHQVSHVIVSHFHPDHWGELPMLVYALKYTTVPPLRDPLVVLGPPGVVRLLKTLAPAYGEWLLDPGFPIGTRLCRGSTTSSANVPWKRSDLGDLVGKPVNSLLDEVLTPVDRDVFKRENRYYDPTTSRWTCT